MIISNNLSELRIVKLNNNSRLKLQLIRTMNFRINRNSITLISILTSTKVMKTMTLNRRILSRTILIRLINGRRTNNMNVRTNSIKTRRILLMRKNATQLNIRIRAAIESSKTNLRSFPRSNSNLMRVNQRLIRVPTSRLITLINIRKARRTKLTNRTSLILMNITNRINIITFRIRLRSINRIIITRRLSNNNNVRIMLIRHQLLQLQLSRRLNLGTSFLNMVYTRIRRLNSIINLTLRLNIPRILMTFTTAPRRMILNTRTLTSLRTLLRLTANMNMSINRQEDNNTKRRTQINRRKKNIPRRLSANKLRVLISLIGSLIRININLTRNITFKNSIAVIRTRMLSTRLLRRLRNMISLNRDLIRQVNMLMMQTIHNTNTRQVGRFLIRNIPPDGTRTRPVLRLLTNGSLINVMMVRNRIFLQSFNTTSMLSLIGVPRARLNTPLR